MICSDFSSTGFTSFLVSIIFTVFPMIQDNVINPLLQVFRHIGSIHFDGANIL
jgi:hypothetical protein